MLTLKHLGDIERKDPLLGQTLRKILQAVNLHGQTAGIDPTGAFPAPAAPTSLSVTAANGFFDAVISDSNPQRGVEYFLDWSTDPGFPAARTIPMGPTRTEYKQLGSQTLYFRCYSQYPGSNPSPYTYFGTQANPTAVVGGGAAGPVPAPSTGTGAGDSAGANPFPPVGVGRGRIGNFPRTLNVL
jgi:hypothetical protein